jgi:hypothetical protein
MDCPFIAAMASIAWVDRNFIINNITAGPSPGNYSFNFWDYPTVPWNPIVALPVAGSPCQINPASLTPVKTTVVVSQTIPLDGSNSPVDTSVTPNMSYGAGSSNNNEIWPALYEKAYAKFILYKNGTLTAGNLTDPTMDPSFSQLQSLTQRDWGGNAGYALQYLTGLNCWMYNLTSTSFSPAGGVSGSATGSLYTYIKAGFCQSLSPNGVGKTKFPLVAWTYFNGSQPAGIQYDASSILAGHCYAVLGVFDAPDGSHYIILRTTFGGREPSPDVPVPNSINLAEPPNYTTWNCYDALFKMATVTGAIDYPKNAVQIPNYISINLANGIFGIEASIPCASGLTTFQNYFAMIGWAGI